MQNHPYPPPVDEPPEADPEQKVKKSWQSRLVGSPVLLLCILLHVLIALIATLWIVQRRIEQKKLGFTEVTMSSSASAASARQQTKVTERKNAIAVPDITPMIAVTDQSAISLPEVSQPADSAPSAMSKMEGTAINGAGLGGGGNGNAPMGMDVGTDALTQAVVESVFGSSNPDAIGLEGRFYDLKQTAGHSPAKMDIKVYADVVTDFVNHDWPDGAFDHYFKSHRSLYAPQIFMPYMNASDGPKAFHMEKEVKPTMWIVLYKGKIQASRTGTFPIRWLRRRCVGGLDQSQDRSQCLLARDHGGWLVGGRNQRRNLPEKNDQRPVQRNVPL